MSIRWQGGSDTAWLEAHGPLFSCGLETEAISAILDGLTRKKIVAIRGDPPEIDAFRRVGRGIGDLIPHWKSEDRLQGHDDVLVVSNRDKAGHVTSRSRGSSHWHIDTAYWECPQLATALHCIESPSHGGETLFVDLERSFTDLPLATRTRLRRLSVLNEGESSSRSATAHAAVHPLVVKDPWSGRETLFLSPAHARIIPELSGTQSDNLLRELIEHLLTPQRVVSYRWRAGDVLFWNNRGLMHKGTVTSDEPRTFYRLCIAGARPVPAEGAGS